MKKTMKKLWLALAAVVSWVGAAVAADIQYVADNSGGEYSGAGYGISVSVSAPASGYAIKYAESSTGPWQEEPITYRDVCAAKPIYFQISAEGYSTVVDSRTVTITPKTLTSDYVWLVLPTDDYVYDGSAKTPDAACGDGDPSIITANDFDVSYSDNVNAGTAKATFTGKGNYTGTVEEEFDIQRADNEWTTEPAMAGWTYGQAPSDPTGAAKVGTAVVTYGTAANPGSLGDAKPSLPGDYAATFTVAESQNYNELATNVEFTISAATINYVADDVSGEYNGSGFGIATTISVSAPATGAVVKYSESETGPWQEEPITYRDVCAAKPIYFQISAEGYSTVVDSRTVTITPKTLTSDYVWLVLPTDDYVYDGSAKTPDAACGDGDPSIITANDFDVSYSDNVNAGTAKATFTGKGNYTGTVEEEFEIKKAKLTDGEEPGGGTVPTGGLSKFDVTAEYDGEAHTVDATAILEAWQGVKTDVAVGYALNEDATDWTEQPESFIDVCVTSVWYKVTLANYDDFVKEVKVTITPRDIANATIDSIADATYSGSPVEPVPTVMDGDPSIITTDDYDVTYSDNNAPGQATLTLMGKGNYTGTTNVNFTILAQAVSAAGLTAEIKWCYLKASGTYFAQLKVICTNGLSAGISDLKFMFADRIGSDGKTEAALWNTLGRAANANTTTYNAETYRFVLLDASLITAENEPVVYGVSDTSASPIPVAERTIEVYVHRRVVPQTGNEGAAKVGDFVGYVGWTSGGETFVVPVVAGGSALHAPLHSMHAAHAPLSRRVLNASLAVGVPISDGASPYCQLMSFSIEGNRLRGVVEVGSTDGERTEKGAVGANAKVLLLGAKTPGGQFVEVASVDVASDGSFEVEKPDGMTFFKLRLDVVDVVK